MREGEELEVVPGFLSPGNLRAEQLGWKPSFGTNLLGALRQIFVPEPLPHL